MIQNINLRVCANSANSANCIFQQHQSYALRKLVIDLHLAKSTCGGVGAHVGNRLLVTISML